MREKNVARRCVAIFGACCAKRSLFCHNLQRDEDEEEKLKTAGVSGVVERRSARKVYAATALGGRTSVCVCCLLLFCVNPWVDIKTVFRCHFKIFAVFH